MKGRMPPKNVPIALHAEVVCAEQAHRIAYLDTPSRSTQMVISSVVVVMVLVKPHLNRTFLWNAHVRRFVLGTVRVMQAYLNDCISELLRAEQTSVARLRQSRANFDR
ncbi:hypothetical protein PILCRDRAFT_812550 [Piloderma croceum F 1598]|uniref:Uncharacterized protein n=1 Tax=Piloderma croceum (strain F 1598) TaxID=765440 RepID=A0A0C3CJ63_PILCF|nr:hypothetical protein PILCRDRAFT_812550 [Piloderma croceum F 1598]